MENKLVYALGIGFVSVLLIMFVTDLSTIFSFSLALDATSSGGKASQQGVDASTGIFKGKGNEKKGTNIGNDNKGKNSDINPTTGDVIDTSTGLVIITGEQVVENSEGGGALGSTVGIGGLQTLQREDVQIFPSIRSPAKGQTITGIVLIQWIGENPLVVQQAQFGRFDEFIDVQLPKTIYAKIPQSIEKEGEFQFKLTIPQNYPEDDFIIPVRMVVDTGQLSHTLVADLQITLPQSPIKSFSFAEAIRSFLALFRVGVPNG